MKLKPILSLILISLMVLGAWLWTPDKPTDRLEALYAGEASEFLMVDGLRVHLRDSGGEERPALLMLHGLGASLHTWDSWTESLSRDFRVIRLDLPGAGLTGPEPGDDYSIERDIALLEALLDQLQLQSVTVMGHSMGGRIAWNFAARRPDRVDRLILLAPDGFASPGFDYGAPPQLPAALSVMKYVLPRFVFQMSLEPAYADPAWMTEAMTTRYYDLMLAPGVRPALLSRMAQTVLVEPGPLLRQITAPTLLVWGEEDAMIPVSNARDYLALLPNARLVVLPGIGHLAQEEQPDKALVEIRKFLSEGQ